MAEGKPIAEANAERVVELRIENFKIFKAARLRFKPTGVTRIVGKNGAGKSTVLDAIMATLGGAGYAGDAPVRKGEKRAKTTVELTKLIVTRTWNGDRSTLEVRNKEGSVFTTPQAVLDQLISEVAFDPLEFSRKTAKQQAETLGALAGFDSAKWKVEYDTLFADRKAVNKRHAEAVAVLRTIPEVDAPDHPVDTQALADELQAALTTQKNAGAYKQAANNQRFQAEKAQAEAIRTQREVERLENALHAAREEHDRAVAAGTEADAKLAELLETAEKYTPTDPVPIQEKLSQAGEINRRVQSKKDRQAKVEAAYALEKEADAFTEKLSRKQEERSATLAALKLGVEGLSVSEDGVCLYNGLPLSSASTAEQLRVGVAIAFALKPALKLAHVKDGSLLDDASMAALNAIAEEAGFQVFVERVAGHGEVGIQIVDGEVAEETVPA